MQEDTLIPAAPTVPPAKLESTVTFVVKIASAALRVSTVRVERQTPRLAQTARLAFIKKIRDKHHAFLAYQERSTINLEKALAIRAHPDFLPTRRSSFNATRVSLACMRHSTVQRSVKCVFQVSTATSPAQPPVKNVLPTRSPLE
jgi:hypothetical protein